MQSQTKLKGPPSLFLFVIVRPVFEIFQCRTFIFSMNCNSMNGKKFTNCPTFIFFRHYESVSKFSFSVRALLSKHGKKLRIDRIFDMISQLCFVPQRRRQRFKNKASICCCLLITPKWKFRTKRRSSSKNHSAYSSSSENNSKALIVFFCTRHRLSILICLEDTAA